MINNIVMEITKILISLEIRWNRRFQNWSYYERRCLF